MPQKASIGKSDFTLFDLTGDDPIIKKFQVYGQFLIIARNQNWLIDLIFDEMGVFIKED